jgi:hypothetical protein
MITVKLAMFCTVLGILAAQVPTPHTNQDSLPGDMENDCHIPIFHTNQDALLDLAGEWAKRLDAVAYGLSSEVPLVAIPLEQNVYFALDLEGGGFEVVGVLEGDILGPSVTCQSGWYSCCRCVWHDGSRVPEARCRRQDQPDGDCQAGGMGSVSCSITKADCTPQ